VRYNFSTMNKIIASPEALLDQLTVPTTLGSRPGLEKIRALLAALGHPEVGLQIVHIGGTSGKGSTATIAAEVLRAAGNRVGLHVKPHLERVEERFVVDGVAISPEELLDLIRDVEEIARDVRPSWYELTVALALRHFRTRGVDLAVVEVGLGGTYDATNVVDPVVAVLTNVGLDHTEILGDTIEKIVADKVGIAKPGRPMVCGVTQSTARAIVAERCASVGARLLMRDVDFATQPVIVSPRGSDFNFRGRASDLRGLALSPLGEHQIENAGLALAALEISGLVDLTRQEEAVRRGLANVTIPGRLEIIGSGSELVLDGAHNPAKMLALVRALDTLFPGRPVHAVVAFKRGHDVAATLGALVGRVSRLALTTFEAVTDFGRGQALSVDDLERICASEAVSVPRSSYDDPRDAVRAMLRQLEPGGLVVVTGSLYLVGAIRGWARGPELAQKLR